MIRRVKLYARLKEPENKYPRIPVQFDRNGRPVSVKGEVTNYYLRIAGKFIDAGEDLTAAVSRMRTEQDRLRDGVRREDVEKVLSPARFLPGNEVPGRTRISNTAAEFVNELRTLDRKKYSIEMYENCLRDFQSSCRKQFIEDITRKDILDFLAWMRENLQIRVPGSENRTYKNKLGYLNTFLGRYGVQLFKQGKAQGAYDPGLLYRSDIPKVIKKKPKKYDQTTIDTLLSKADVDERDYLEFLLWSGFRDEEVQYLQFSDFNFNKATVMVQAKPQFGWKPKDYEEREITLPTPVIKRMQNRITRVRQYSNGMRKATDVDLVFPNSDGRPDSHLIYRLHAVAKKAGLNLVGKRAGHLFRKTAGSRVAKSEGLPAAMEFLGHSDIKTTALYLAADTASQTKKRQSADRMYKHHQNSGND